MSSALPKWAFERYTKLWKRFSNKEFSHKQAKYFLKEKKDTTLSLVIQELKKAGWITVSLDLKDSRKRLYKLKSPEQAIKEMKN